MSAQTPDTIVVYSTVWCPDCKRAKKFFIDDPRILEASGMITGDRSTSPLLALQESKGTESSS